MASVRTLKLFTLEQLSVPYAESPIDSCPQPAEAFSVDVGSKILTIAPATLFESGYVPMSLQRAMLWNWRIKEWNVVIDVAYDQYAFKGTATLPSNCTSEMDKVCNATVFSNEETITGNPEETDGTWELKISIGAPDVAWSNYPLTPKSFAAASQPIRFSADKSTFFYNVNIELYSEHSSAIFSVSLTGSSSENVGTIPITYTFKDDIETTTRNFRIGGSAVIDLQDYTGNILFTPKSYWPYDPGDGGGPIYDSETGAQLRSFS